jgi:uncharacterized protein YcgI (DUF1989 family)
MADVPGIPGFRLKQEVLTPAMHGCAFRVAQGDRFQIVDVQGQQVGDLVAFKAADPAEYFSPKHTVTQNWSIALRPGFVLASNRRSNLMRVVEDTVGYHDLVVPCCDPETYITRYGIYDHRSCLVNMQEGLASIGLGDWEVHGENAWNVFMKTRIEPDGKMVYLESTHGPGSFMTLDALEDLVCALSACPQDQTPINGPACTEMLVRIWEPA